MSTLRRLWWWAQVLGEAAYYCAIDLSDALWRIEQRVARFARRVR